MAKATNPTTFSTQFDVDRQELRHLGVLDPTLAIDTKLFIDPLLFRRSKHVEIRDQAVDLYRRHFETVIKLLGASKAEGDVAWRAARRNLQFPEIKGTCLGYGAGSISGSGFGPALTARVQRVAKEIVDLGVTDPDLFSALAIFEEGIGPDRISDMATNVVRESLVAFNLRVLGELEVKAKPEMFDLHGISARLLRNPLQTPRTPIILVPKDVLRPLPIATDWDEVSAAASHNSMLRRRVNRHIGAIWSAKTRRDKKDLREQALSSRDAFQALLDSIHAARGDPYDAEIDPEGLVRWAKVAEDYAHRFPIELAHGKPKPQSADQAEALVDEIIIQFAHLVEKRGLNRELYRERGRPKHESTAQKLFFAVAYSYCKANNIDVSPEIDTGTGKIDFKFSKGFTSKVLVELKLSTNAKLPTGYASQLGLYRDAEETSRAIYLVIDVGGPRRRLDRLESMRKTAAKAGERASKVVVIDALLRPTASKR